VIQKQIIADTEALAKNAKPEKFKEIAAREKEAIEFGNLYRENLEGASSEAAELMNSALEDMQRAAAALERGDRAQALPPEESALARFYQIIKLMPELENLPTQPPQGGGENQPRQEQSPKIKVVLEAIKKKKEQQQDNQEIAELLEQIRQMSQAQASLNQACKNPASNPSDQAGAALAQGKEKPNEKPTGAQPTDSHAPGQPQQGPPQDGQAESPQKQNPSNANAQNGNDLEPKESELQASGKDLAELAKQEEQLEKEAAALAEKLGKLAGKDTRLGHNATKAMNEAPPRMKAAAQAWRMGNRRQGYNYGQETYYSLNVLASILEKILEKDGKLADTSAEDYPKEYDAAIKEYLRRLSYQE
jgi:hypothetical protein